MTTKDYQEIMSYGIDAIISLCERIEDDLSKMSEQMTALNVAVQRSNRK